MSLSEFFYRFLEKTGITNLETKLAACLGRFWRDRVLKNRPLEGVVSEVFMTRGKIRGQSKNIIIDGFATEEFIKSIDSRVYEVVYQARLLEDSGRQHILSLFRHQLWILGSRVRITKYNCIFHIGHFILFRAGIISGNAEIYPVEIELVRP